MSPRDQQREELKNRRDIKKNHDDSEFVYLKVEKKTCKETILFARKVINDPEFEIEKKDKSDPSFCDINQSLLYKDRDP